MVERLQNTAAAYHAVGMCQRLAALFSNSSLRVSPANTREQTENLTRSGQIIGGTSKEANLWLKEVS